MTNRQIARGAGVTVDEISSHSAAVIHNEADSF